MKIIKKKKKNREKNEKQKQKMIRIVIWTSPPLGFNLAKYFHTDVSISLKVQVPITKTKVLFTLHQGKEMPFYFLLR